MREIVVNYPEYSNIKIYAKVPSESRTGLNHIVLYVRTAHNRFWHCTCEDYAIRKRVSRRSCKHIREVRETLGKTR